MPRTDHDIPLVGGTLTVVFTSRPFDEAAERYELRVPKWMSKPDYRAAAALMYHARPRREAVQHWIVMLHPSANAGVIAHEALHVVVAMNKFYGWPAPKGRADEPSAYLLQEVVDLICASPRR